MSGSCFQSYSQLLQDHSGLFPNACEWMHDGEDGFSIWVGGRVDVPADRTAAGGAEADRCRDERALGSDPGFSSKHDGGLREKLPVPGSYLMKLLGDKSHV